MKKRPLTKSGDYATVAIPSRADAEVTDEISIDDISIDEIPIKNFFVKLLAHQDGRPSDSAIDQVIDRATEVIGDREEATRWLGTPVRGLDFATPISLLATVEGQTRVYKILGQMEHGIW